MKRREFLKMIAGTAVAAILPLPTSIKALTNTVDIFGIKSLGSPKS